MSTLTQEGCLLVKERVIFTPNESRTSVSLCLESWCCLIQMKMSCYFWDMKGICAYMYTYKINTAYSLFGMSEDSLGWDKNAKRFISACEWDRVGSGSDASWEHTLCYQARIFSLPDLCPMLPPRLVLFEMILAGLMRWSSQWSVHLRAWEPGFSRISDLQIQWTILSHHIYE